MVRSAQAGLTSFARSHVFALDEFGGLPRDDEGLARNILPKILLEPAGLPKEAFHTLDAWASDLDRVCREYDERVSGTLDLVLLGIGVNGHLGMNEPGSAKDSPTRRVDLHPTTIQSSARYFAHKHLPTWGLTVGLGPILAAKEIWVLATGPNKSKIVREMVHGGIGVTIPASLLRDHSNCSLFVDVDAGALL
jgi:6-phosphogluconolactonase/glucosamine-6-phosphate isomerase/deaminase